MSEINRLEQEDHARYDESRRELGIVIDRGNDDTEYESSVKAGLIGELSLDKLVCEYPKLLDIVPT